MVEGKSIMPDNEIRKVSYFTYTIKIIAFFFYYTFFKLIVKEGLFFYFLANHSSISEHSFLIELNTDLTVSFEISVKSILTNKRLVRVLYDVFLKNVSLSRNNNS